MQLSLYVKVWCPWCVRAQEWLDARGYRYELIDVEAKREDYDTMIRLSQQRLTPTLVVSEGEEIRWVLPDFGPDELEAFLKRRQISP